MTEVSIGFVSTISTLPITYDHGVQTGTGEVLSSDEASSDLELFLEGSLVVVLGSVVEALDGGSGRRHGHGQSSSSVGGGSHFWMYLDIGDNIANVRSGRSKIERINRSKRVC